MKKLLGRPSPATVIAVTALIAALGGTAVAGGVLNKKTVNKIITKRAPGLSVASAKNADKLGGVGSGGFLPSSGSFQVQEGIDSFVATGTSTVSHPTGFVRLAGNTSSQFFYAPLTVPSLVQGRPTQLDSVVFCYAADATATLDQVEVPKITDATGSSSVAYPVFDTTNRTDAACRTYAPASPVTVGPDDSLEFVVEAQFTAASFISVTRLTVNMST